MDRLYRVGFEFAHNAIQAFWKPSRLLQRKVDHYYKTHFEGNWILGLQLRLFYIDWCDVLAIVKCAQELERNIESKSIKWFISTDDEETLKMLKNLYPNKVIHADGLIAHVAENTNSYFRTLLDIELLSRCDDLIISGGSTFGFLAAIKRGEYPLFLDGKQGKNECQRFSFSNPGVSFRNVTFI